MQFTVVAYGSLVETVLRTEGKECDESGAINLKQDVENSLERAPAILLEPKGTEVKRRRVLIMTVREAIEQVLTTRI